MLRTVDVVMIGILLGHQIVSVAPTDRSAAVCLSLVLLYVHPSLPSPPLSISISFSYEYFL